MALVTCVAAVVAGVLAVAPGVSRAAAADASGPYRETLVRQGARLAAEAGKPQAVGALATELNTTS